MPPSKIPPVKISSVSSGALPALLLAALLLVAGAATSWYERGIEAEARALAEEIAASIVPDEALVPSAVKGARVNNDALSAALALRFVPRHEPVAALRVIESAAKEAGIASSFSHVDVAGWNGDPAALGELDPAAATSSPYAAVVAGVGATGPWAKVLAFAADLENLPVAARVDALRLASALDALGKPAWSLSAEVTVLAK